MAGRMDAESPNKRQRLAPPAGSVALSVGSLALEAVAATQQQANAKPAPSRRTCQLRVAAAHRLPHGATATAAAPNSSCVACGDSGGALHLFTSTGSPRTVAAHADGVLCLAWGAAGALLTGGEDGHARLWDTAASGERATASWDLGAASVGTTSSGAGAWVEHAAYCDALAVFAVTCGRSVAVLRAGAASAAVVEPPLPSTPGGVGFSATALVAACYGGVYVWPWDAAAGAHACAAAAARRFEYKNGWLTHLAVRPVPAAGWLAAACNDRTLRLFRATDGAELQMGGYPSRVTSLAWAPGGTLLATAGGAMVSAWDFSSGSPASTTPYECRDSASPEPATVTCMAWRPAAADGRPSVVLAVGTNSGRLAVYDLAAYEPGNWVIGRLHLCHQLASMKVASGPVAGLAWGGADRVVVAAEDGAVVVCGVAGL